jgi:hypothetical protein
MTGLILPRGYNPGGGREQAEFINITQALYWGTTLWGPGSQLQFETGNNLYLGAPDARETRFRSAIARDAFVEGSRGAENAGFGARYEHLA